MSDICTRKFHMSLHNQEMSETYFTSKIKIMLDEMKKIVVSYLSMKNMKDEVKNLQKESLFTQTHHTNISYYKRSIIMHINM